MCEFTAELNDLNGFQQRQEHIHVNTIFIKVNTHIHKWRIAGLNAEYLQAVLSPAKQWSGCDIVFT